MVLKYETQFDEKDTQSKQLNGIKVHHGEADMCKVHNGEADMCTNGETVMCKTNASTRQTKMAATKRRHETHADDDNIRHTTTTTTTMTTTKTEAATTNSV